MLVKGYNHKLSVQVINTPFIVFNVDLQQNAGWQ